MSHWYVQFECSKCKKRFFREVINYQTSLRKIEPEICSDCGEAEAK